MNEQNVVCSCNKMLFGHKREVLVYVTTPDEPWKTCYSEGASHEGHTYYKVPMCLTGKSIQTESRLVVAKVGELENGERLLMEWKCKIACGDDLHTKNHQIVYFNWVNCMVCELYLNKSVIFEKFVNIWRQMNYRWDSVISLTVILFKK